jgi:hypothetical protein
MTTSVKSSYATIVFSMWSRRFRKQSIEESMRRSDTYYYSILSGTKRHSYRIISRTTQTGFLELQECGSKKMRQRWHFGVLRLIIFYAISTVLNSLYDGYTSEVPNGLYRRSRSTLNPNNTNCKVLSEALYTGQPGVISDWLS